MEDELPGDDAAGDEYEEPPHVPYTPKFRFSEDIMVQRSRDFYALLDGVLFSMYCGILYWCNE